MTTPDTTPGEDEATEEPSPSPEDTARRQSTSRAWARTLGSVGGLGGLALLITAVTNTGFFQPDREPSPGPTVTATVTVSATAAASAATAGASVKLSYPAQHGEPPAEIGLCQEFRGMSKVPPGFVLWLAGRLESETQYELFGKVNPPVDASQPWKITAQVGGPAQAGEMFEITAVFIPQDMSDYLLAATNYESKNLVPHGDSDEVVGLLDKYLPPGTDTEHTDTILVRRGKQTGSC